MPATMVIATPGWVQNGSKLPASDRHGEIRHVHAALENLPVRALVDVTPWAKESSDLGVAPQRRGRQAESETAARIKKAGSLVARGPAHTDIKSPFGERHDHGGYLTRPTLDPNGASYVTHPAQPEPLPPALRAQHQRAPIPSRGRSLRSLHRNHCCSRCCSRSHDSDRTDGRAAGRSRCRTSFRSRNRSARRIRRSFPQPGPLLRRCSRTCFRSYCPTCGNGCGDPNHPTSHSFRGQTDPHRPATPWRSGRRRPPRFPTSLELHCASSNCPPIPNGPDSQP